jgi:hypothetical protein
MIQYIKNLSKTRKITYFLLIFGLIQLIRCDRSVPPYDPKYDIIMAQKTSPEVLSLLKIACYDCHSYETKYPWYSQVAPVSWWMDRHVNQGRKKINFSTFMTYTAKKAIHKLDECVETIVENRMPLSSYTWLHKDAKLTKSQKNILVRYFEEKKKIYVSE